LANITLNVPMLDYSSYRKETTYKNLLLHQIAPQILQESFFLVENF